MNPQLKEALNYLRLERNFKPDQYLVAKASLINEYFRQNRIKTALVGVSGGIDSAVSIALLSYAAKQKDSPISQVVAAILPISESVGASNQLSATERGKLVAKTYAAKIVEADLSLALKSYKTSIDQAAGVVGKNWSEGQLASYSRTPALYYLASLFAEQGSSAIVCGTTNRDEGAYIGFFGKASDGMVDLQVLSDIHKSEVYQIAELLEMPHAIISAIPSGDTFDGRPDHEMIGVSYDAVELYQLYQSSDNELQSKILANFDRSALSEFNLIKTRLDQLHQHNRHKYLASPASIHLDLYDRAVPSGWTDTFNPERNFDAMVDSKKLVGNFKLNLENSPFLNKPNRPTVQLSNHPEFNQSLFEISNLLDQDECDFLINSINKELKIPVGLDGRMNSLDSNPGSIGSYRSTTVNLQLAELIWAQIKKSLPRFKLLDQKGFTDGSYHPVWRAIGVNPVLRFISYKNQGELIPHYDAGYDFQDDRRYTLMSFIIYLNDAPTQLGGATRFIRDPQRHLPITERNFADWNMNANDFEVLTTVQPKAGSAIIFDHRLLHDCQTWHGDSDRVILRTDLIFERCGVMGLPNFQRLEPELRIQPPEGLPAIKLSATRAEVDQIYANYRALNANTLPANFDELWKILRDPFYRSIYAPNHSLEEVYSAGFFIDSGTLKAEQDPRTDKNWLVTPLNKINNRLKELKSQANIASKKELAVLLTTGSFCPIHSGHIEMMNIAKQTVELDGYTVLGGYISPSNDEYVLKKCGADIPKAAHRISLCEAAVSTSDWLMIDPWEALHCDYDINFTETIERLSNYLSKHINTAQAIRVFYVFGGDNAHFAKTFTKRGYCVVIPRSGSIEKVNQTIQELGINRPDRILFAKQNTLGDISSTQIRSGNMSSLNDGVRDKWQKWQNNTELKNSPNATIAIRDEGKEIYQHWQNKCDAIKLENARKEFSANLLEYLRISFQEAIWPDSTIKLDTKIISLEEQRKHTQNLALEKVISLDPFIKGQVNLQISRCFELIDSSAYLGIVARPGAANLKKQFQDIPTGEYTLLDDDSLTGLTVEFVKQQLPANCLLEQSISLAQSVESLDAILDLGDSRDFLVGSFEGGLVVQLPSGELARAPYLYPYVRPSLRISLPVSQELNFSLAVWKLNRDFYQAQNTLLKISDCPQPFQLLAKYIGFLAETSLVEFCDWHIQRLALSVKDCNFYKTRPYEQ